MTGYSLKAGCVHCNRWGTIDDVTLVCAHCGGKHEITDSEDAQRAADMALWSAAMEFRKGQAA